MSLLYIGLGAAALYLISVWKKEQNTTNHREVENHTTPPPRIRDPIGGNSVFYGYFGRTNTPPKNSNVN